MVLFSQAEVRGGACCFLVVGVLIVTLIGAIILRTACWLFNKLAGGPNAPGAIPEPDFGQAMLMAFVTMLVQFGVSFLVGLVVGGGGAATGASQQQMEILSSMVTLPISFLVLSGIVAGMLPTSFVKGMAVAALYWVVAIIIAVVLIVVLSVVGAALIGMG